MPYTKLRYHIVFATKARQPFIDERVESHLNELLRNSAEKADGRITEFGAVDDHIHLIAGIRPKKAVSTFVQRIKGDSSREIKKRLPRMHRFAWQVGFGAFTINPFDSLDIRKYVRNQKEHHADGTTRPRYEQIDRNEEDEEEGVECA